MESAEATRRSLEDKAEWGHATLGGRTIEDIHVLLSDRPDDIQEYREQKEEACRESPDHYSYRGLDSQLETIIPIRDANVAHNNPVHQN